MNAVENTWLNDLAILQKQKKEAMTECVNLSNIEKKSLHNVIIFGRENP